MKSISFNDFPIPTTYCVDMNISLLRQVGPDVLPGAGEHLARVVRLYRQDLDIHLVPGDRLQHLHDKLFTYNFYKKK